MLMAFSVGFLFAKKTFSPEKPTPAKSVKKVQRLAKKNEGISRAKVKADDNSRTVLARWLSKKVP